MKRRTLGEWLLPVALALTAGGFMAWAAARVRIPEVEAGYGRRLRAPELSITRVDWMPAGGALRETLRLLDPTPLFMPSGRGEIGGAVDERERGWADGADAAEMTRGELVYAPQNPTRGLVRKDIPRTLLTVADWLSGPRWFESMARVESASKIADAAARGRARVDVYEAGTATKIASVAVDPDPSLAGELWQPVELRVYVDSAGVIGSPLLIKPSESSEIDDRVRRVAKAEILPRLRLRPGAYRIVVGP